MRENRNRIWRTHHCRRQRLTPRRTLLRPTWLAVSLLVALSCSTWAAPECANWNTEEFFDSALAADVRHCLASGASLEQRDKDGWTALPLAAEVGSAEQVVVVLELGATTGARDEDGSSALYSAARGGTAATVAALLRARADVGAENEPGRTPLHVAAYGAEPANL